MDGEEHRVGVDWERRRLCVLGNPKVRNVYREVPIAPRLYRVLVRAFDAAPPGAVTVCGLSEHNLTRLGQDRVKAAGLTHWPKLYQALRSSCENDWKAGGVAEPTCCAWIGHGSNVSRGHYVAPMESDFLAVIRGSAA